MRRKQRGSSSAESIWKVLLILLALTCALRPAQGRVVSVGYPGPRSNKASIYHRGGGGCSSIDECDAPPAPGEEASP
uniref:Uncharacterized protein n=1 Tax=Oryza meridionalis TaxID=40149 RepID=A0A0E0E9V9_9ORYZ